MGTPVPSSVNAVPVFSRASALAVLPTALKYEL